MPTTSARALLEANSGEPQLPQNARVAVAPLAELTS
jgi:hypothetical protein